jgi:hypothetical protein
MRRCNFKTILGALGLAAAVALPVTLSATAAPTPQGAYAISLFAADNISGCSTAINDASATCYYNADSLTNDASFVYVGYQNNGAADGSSGHGIVAGYARAGGAPLAFFGPFAGKIDGLRINPFTGQLWALDNEDGNTVLRIIDPSTGAIVLRSALTANTPFGGGYDDLAFTPGATFMSASNPGLTKNGTNNYRAVVRVDLVNGAVVLNPALPGQVVATDRSTGAPVKVTITDPDSLSLIPGTDTYVLDGQGDSTLLFVEKIGGGDQHVSALFLQPAPSTNCGLPPAPPAVPCPPIVDETTWATTSGGHFLVADHHKPGAIYLVTRAGGFAPGTAYTTVSSDNPTLKNTLATLDTTSGLITPVVTGFSSPKGLIYLTP